VSASAPCAQLETARLDGFDTLGSITDHLGMIDRHSANRLDALLRWTWKPTIHVKRPDAYADISLHR